MRERERFYSEKENAESNSEKEGYAECNIYACMATGELTR